jgi:signal transduction histidine kinase
MLSTAVRAVAQSIRDVHAPQAQGTRLLLDRLSELEALIRRAQLQQSNASAASGIATDATSRQLLDLMRRQILLTANTSDDTEGYTESHRLLIALELLQVPPDLSENIQLPWLRRDAATTDVLVEVAHDMRSPLGAILFLVDRVRSGQSGPVNDAQRKQLGLAYSAAFELNALTADLTELARGGRRLTEAEPMPFAISTVVLSVEAMVRPIAEEKGLQFAVHVPQRDVRIGNAAALTRVLLNLCTNACKFTDSGKVALSVEIGSEECVTFAVRDTGRGLPPELASSFLGNVHAALHSSSARSSTRFSSAGLGLAICSRLVTAMGGSLSLAESPEGEHSTTGTTLMFTLRLPRV